MTKLAGDTNFDGTLLEFIRDRLVYNKDSANEVIISCELANYDTCVALIGYDRCADYIREVFDEIVEILPSKDVELTKTNFNLRHLCMGIKVNNSEEVDKFVSIIYNTINEVQCDNNCPVVLKYKLISLDSEDGLEDEAEEEIMRKFFALREEALKENNVNSHIRYSDYTNIIATTESTYHKARTICSALNNDRLRFAFQPIISSKTGEVDHYECLLRMIQHDGEFKSAGPYIPAAEELGIMPLIDKKVFEMVSEELKHSPDDVCFSFNLSKVALYTPGFVQKLKTNLKEMDYTHRLVIELTETSLNFDISYIKKFISEMHECGCRVALDDFGSGYTSFKQLKQLPVDIIKIDGTFIKNILFNIDNKIFIETLNRIANELGAHTVAEFVENGELAKYLINIEIDFLQGNYFSPAVHERSWDKK
jgi:EAL domain-containing protein (putative c-di-GMP-specific phosphodiesterase class I)